jgi:hypothetical protein
MLRTLLKRRTLAYALVVAVLVLAVGGGYSLAASSSAGTIKVCASKSTGVLKLAHGKCRHGARSLSWNKVGRAGTPGTPGAPGANGTNGTNGTNAASNVVVRVGTTSTNVGTTGTILTVRCHAGERATGAGARSTSTLGDLVDSIPTVGASFTFATDGQTPDGGWLDVKTSSGTADYTPYVVCAS